MGKHHIGSPLRLSFRLLTHQAEAVNFQGIQTKIKMQRLTSGLWFIIQTYLKIMDNGTPPHNTTEKVSKTIYLLDYLKTSGTWKQTIWEMQYSLNLLPSASKINGKFNTSIVLTVVFTAAAAAHMKKSFPRAEIKGTATMWHGMGLHYNNFTDCSEWKCVWYKLQVFRRKGRKIKTLKKWEIRFQISHFTRRAVAFCTFSRSTSKWIFRAGLFQDVTAQGSAFI